MNVEPVVKIRILIAASTIVSVPDLVFVTLLYDGVIAYAKYHNSSTPNGGVSALTCALPLFMTTHNLLPHTL